MGICISQIDSCVEFLVTEIDEDFHDSLYDWELNPTEGTIDFVGEKLRGSKESFAKLKGILKTGSYVEMQSECGDLWRWVLTDKGVDEIYPNVVW